MNKPVVDKYAEIDIQKLIDNNQQEITKFYNSAKNYFLWFFNSDEELYNDFVVHIVKWAYTYKKEISPFYVWLYTIAQQMRNKKTFSKDERQLKCNISIDAECDISQFHQFEQTIASSRLDFLANPIDDELEYKMYKNHLKNEMKAKISKLKVKDQDFINTYFHKKKHPDKDRMKFSRLIDKLQVMK